MDSADRRLASLWATELLDSPPEPAFDRVTRLAAASLRAPVALVSLVDADRQFFKSATGLPEPWASQRQTPLSHSFCQHVVQQRASLVVNDARTHPLVSDNLAIADLNVIAYLGVPLRAPDGFVIGSLCVIDTVPRDWHEGDIALLSDAAMIVEGAIAARLAAAAVIDGDAQWRFVLDVVPNMVWSTLADGSADYFNKRYYDFTGLPSGASDGDVWMQLIHPGDRARIGDSWQAATGTGSLYEIEYRLRHNSGDYRWVLARALPMRDEVGQIVRWVGTCTNIDAVKRSEEARELISQELTHRIKNIFAVVSALVSISVRDAPEAADYARNLRNRLLALGAAHDYVRPNSDVLSRGAQTGQSVHGLLESLLVPYRSAGCRIVIGDIPLRVGLSAATALALLIHELATNAVKYGALSQPGGRLHISGDTGDGLCIVWRERGGPAIDREPAQTGFGSSMVMRAATTQLRGRLAYDWDPEGLSVTFATDLENLVS